MTASSHYSVVVEGAETHGEKHSASNDVTIQNVARPNISEHRKRHESSAETKLIGLTTAIIYGVCSASMAFANKALLTSYNYTYQVFLIFVQMVVTLLSLEILRFLKLTSLPAFSLRRGWSFLVPSALYALHSILALSALTGMNIPMYGVVKRCAPMAILILGVVILKKDIPNCLVTIAVSLITIGCIIAGYGDLAFDPRAYSFGVISVLTQSIYLLLVQRSAATYSATEVLHLNCCNTLLPLLACSLITGEFGQAIRAFDYHDLGFVAMFTMVVCMGAVLNYLLFLCTTLNSALTTSITGTLKGIIQTIIGMFTFGGISINIFTIWGISLNLIGGIIYSFAKLKQTWRRETQVERVIISLEKEVSPPNLNGKIV